LPIQLPKHLPSFHNELSQVYNQMIDSLLFVICAEYVLAYKDTLRKEQYGRFGNTYYDRQYGAGIVANGLLYFNADLQKPWTAENKHTSYADSLYPQLSRFDIVPFQDKSYVSKQKQIIKAGDDIAATAISPYRPTATWWKGKEPATGKMVFVFRKPSRDANEVIFEKCICSVSPRWVKEEANIPLPFTSDKKLIAGFLFYERITAGQLKLELGGVLINSKGLFLQLKKVISPLLQPIKSSEQSHKKSVTNGF
jgi:hypothetical protein